MSPLDRVRQRLAVAGALWAAGVLIAAGAAAGVALGASLFLGASPAVARPASSGTAICLPYPCPTTTTSTTTTTTTAPPTTAPGSGTTSTSSTTAAQWSSTTVATPPSSVPSSPYSAGFLPCGTAATGPSTGPATGPCTQEPVRVELQYRDGASPPEAIELQWVSDGRPATSPAPASLLVKLAWSSGSDCGSNLRCWPWPGQMSDSSFVLNGTYRVVPCGTYSTGNCGTAFPAVTIGLAVPPGPPAAVQARSAGGEVTMSWKPPAASPPDLVGYAVSRNGRNVYACSIDGLGPGASVPCPRSLTVADHPGNGRYRYAVAALRLGVDSTAGAVVASAYVPNAGAAVPVPGPVTGRGPGAGGAGPGFTPSPVIGGSVGLIQSGGTVSPTGFRGQDLGGVDAAPDLGAPGTPQNLRYPDQPAVGRSSALSVRIAGDRSRSDVVHLAVLALGVLALAIAAHILYLRQELAALQGRLAARRPTD